MMELLSYANGIILVTYAAANADNNTTIML